MAEDCEDKKKESLRHLAGEQVFELQPKENIKNGKVRRPERQVKKSEVFMEDNSKNEQAKCAKKTAKKKNSAEGVGDALMKVALGCSVAEVTEEYAEVDGKLKLLKRKKTKKDIPPDLKAVQLILEKQGGGGGISALSDEELEKEKQRLLKLLNGNAEQ